MTGLDTYIRFGIQREVPRVNGNWVIPEVLLEPPIKKNVMYPTKRSTFFVSLFELTVRDFLLSLDILDNLNDSSHIFTLISLPDLLIDIKASSYFVAQRVYH